MALPSSDFIPAAVARDTVESLHAELGPPRPWIYPTILVLAFSVLIALPLVQVDVTVRAAGFVRAATDRTDLRTAVAGQIARLWKRDNAPVTAGEPVLELASTALDERLAHNRARQEAARDLVHDLSLLSTAVVGVAVHHHQKTTAAVVESLLTERAAPRAFQRPKTGRSTAADDQPSEAFAPPPALAAPLSVLRAPLFPISDSSPAELSSFRSLISTPGFQDPLPPAAATGAVAAEASKSVAAGGLSRIAGRKSAGKTGPAPDNRFGTAGSPGLAVTDKPDSPPAGFRSQVAAMELAELRTLLSAQAVTEARARTELERVTVLHDRGIAARRELDDARFALARAEAEAEHLRQQSLTRWQSRLRGEQLALMALVSEEAHLGDERSSFTVRSPIAGTLLGLAGLAEGTWVAAGQIIASVSPADRLVVEAAVPAHRIGFIREGQPVKIAVDTYPPTEWGTLDATARTVSADLHSTADGAAPHYRVLIAPHRSALTRPDGAIAPLRKGMTVDARFQVARRSLLQLFYEDSARWLDQRAPQRR